MSSDPRATTPALVEPILREVARSLLAEKSALFASSSSPSPLPCAAAAAAAAAEPPPPLQLRYPRDPRVADAFTSELTARALAKLASLGLPCKWAASCSLSARAGGGSAAAAAGVFEEEALEEEEEEEQREGGGGGGGKEATKTKETPRRRSGGDSVCSVQVEEGGVALTVTAAWVRCL